jgi:hypothetical protein
VLDQARTYDYVGDVFAAQTTLPVGTPACQTITLGGLASANYWQRYAYDPQNRVTRGPLGTATPLVTRRLWML